MSFSFWTFHLCSFLHNFKMNRARKSLSIRLSPNRELLAQFLLEGPETYGYPVDEFISWSLSPAICLSVLVTGVISIPVSVCRSVRPSVSPLVRPSIHLSVCPYFHQSVPPSLRGGLEGLRMASRILSCSQRALGSFRKPQEASAGWGGGAQYKFLYR